MWLVSSLLCHILATATAQSRYPAHVEMQTVQTQSGSHRGLAGFFVPLMKGTATTLHRTHGSIEQTLRIFLGIYLPLWFIVISGTKFIYPTVPNTHELRGTQLS